MPRDTTKYLYVEIALPIEHPSVKTMQSQVRQTGHKLRALVSAAAIEAYYPGEEDDSGVEEARVVVKKVQKKGAKKPPAAISSASVGTAADMMADYGF